MEKFNYDSYMKSNPLLKETSGIGNYVQPEKMFGSPDYIDSDEYDYMTDDELDAAEASGKLSPSNAKLGPDEELMEGSGKVMAVKEMIVDRIESAIAKSGLDEEDLNILRKELAQHFGR